MEFASNAKGNAALTTGIIGTAGVGLGLLGNLLGNGMGKCEGAVSHYEMQQSARISELETEVKLRDANIYTDSKMLELYKYFDGKLDCVNAALSQQSVVNAQVAANLSCMQSSIAALQGLTKLVVPIDSVCPEPMKQYNSWVAPTASA